MTATIQTFINDKEVQRRQVLAWEQRRALAVLKKLGVKPTGTDLTTLHLQLLARKAELGSEGVLHLLRREIALSDHVTGLVARLSRGARRFCMIELLSDRGSAEQFVAWFEARSRANDDHAMLGATPDHYLLHTDAQGTMQVVETTGGMPLASRFFMNPADQEGLRAPVDTDFPLQIAGVARLKNGLAIGGVRHQLRNEGSGFRIRLIVEFPGLMLQSMINGHQWHLASEFTNWIEASLTAD
jgi:hypothetical protein